MQTEQSVNAEETIISDDVSTTEQAAFVDNETNLESASIEEEEKEGSIAASSEQPDLAEEDNADEAEASTSVAKKPRHRQVNAAMREVEQRILKQVDERLSSGQQSSENQQNQADQIDSAAYQQSVQYQMRVNDFQKDCSEISSSDNAYDQKVAKTLNAITGNQNPLSYLSAETTVNMINDGITPAEIHEISERFEDKIQPSTPDVEFRTIKMLRAKLKSETRQKKTVKTAPKPSGSISGGTTTPPSRDDNYYFNLFRGRK